ncbi:MAG: prepilin peptidase [Parcubacteria group bacterium]|nr:prepilin peptidase [Parcubacteria group bacterium]
MDSIVFFYFVLGLFVGSFLNVVVLRLNTGRDMVHSRSSCFSCGKTLSWYELIPLVSFFVQNGRCRRCKSKISWQYPIVELTSGFLFASVAWHEFGIWNGDVLIGQILDSIFYILIFSVLLAITVYDARHKIIPNILVYVFDALAFLTVLGFGNWSLLGDSSLKIENFITGLIFFSFFAGIWFLSQGRWMGFGDAKLALGLGWLLGPSLGIAGLVLSFWIGALFGLAALSIRRLFSRWGRDTISLQSEIPFAPFLVVGAFLAFLFDIGFFDLQNLFVLYVF